jgi:hypothetical protein
MPILLTYDVSENSQQEVKDLLKKKGFSEECQTVDLSGKIIRCILPDTTLIKDEATDSAAALRFLKTVVDELNAGRTDKIVIKKAFAVKFDKNSGMPADIDA